MKRPVLPKNQVSFFSLMATEATPEAAAEIIPAAIVVSEEEITVPTAPSFDLVAEIQLEAANNVARLQAEGWTPATFARALEELLGKEIADVVPDAEPISEAELEAEVKIPEVQGTNQVEPGVLPEAASAESVSSAFISDGNPDFSGSTEVLSETVGVDGAGLGNSDLASDRVPTIASVEALPGRQSGLITGIMPEFAGMFASDSEVPAENATEDASDEEYPLSHEVEPEATTGDEITSELLASVAEIEAAPMATSGAAMHFQDFSEDGVALQLQFDSVAPDVFVLTSEPVVSEQVLAVSPSTVVFEEVATAGMSVTFHKHGKRLMVKANDALAADLWREISERLKNQKMLNLNYFDSNHPAEAIPGRQDLLELWQWVDSGLEAHPFFEILQSYGLTATISPSLAGYMAREKKRVAIRSTPYSCYESSPDDISETIINGMILKCKLSTREDPEWEANKDPQVNCRYMVKGVTEEGLIEVYTQVLANRASLKADSEIWTITKEQVSAYFEDSDKFTVESDVRQKYPELVGNIERRLELLPTGQPGRLFKHSWQDIGTEVQKGNFLTSKDMRMGKSREVLSAAELIGSKRVAWIAPAMALIDTPSEFQKAGVTDFCEVTKISDLANPARYHLMTYDFLKNGTDPLKKTRRGNTKKTWLRLVSEGKSIVDCPHCEQPLERAIKTYNIVGRIIHVRWTLQNGYVCRNPFCLWTEINEGRMPSRKSGKQKVSPTPWHSAGDVKAITHQGGYIDWERKLHANCGDHVGRKRICPKCGIADATWTPGIYKRIKKDYNTVILDEIHVTKDGGSNTSKAALDMRGKHHIGASGTPIANSLLDIFEQFMWLFHTKSSYFPYDRDHGKVEFKERFCESIKITNLGTDKSHYKTSSYPKDPLDFWNFAAPLLVRRTRADAVYKESLDELGMFQPVATTYVTPVRMIAPQAHLLASSIETFKADFADYCMELEESGKALNSNHVINLMGRMKIAATIPGFLNKPGMPKVYEGGEMDPFEVGGKGVALRLFVANEMLAGRKVVLMSQYVMMRERMVEMFADLNPVVMSGGSVKKKRESLDVFRLNADRKLAVVGTQQVCVGVDLSCADTLANTDLMWAAIPQNQALARLMGPTPYPREVKNYIFNSEFSIDEHVYNVFYGKIAGAEQALDKRIVTRTVQSVDWIAFSDTIVAQQAALENYFRVGVNAEIGITMPDFGDSDEDDERAA